MGLHERYARLLSDAPDVFMAGRKERENVTGSPLCFSKEIRKKLSVLFDDMMKTLYKTSGAQMSIDIFFTPQVREFINSHSAVLDSSFEKVEMSDAMRKRLRRSDFIFSGIKTFHELNEAFPSLIDENGNRKPFERFLNDVRSIDRTYNSHYLRAEYNFVNASAEMAARWEGFMQDGDRYNLQYRTQHDDKVRPEHAALDRVTLPPSDSFWEEFYPPNGWNCRCTVAQVRKSKYPATPHAEAMRLGDEALQRDSKGIFRFNPGLEQKTVPDYNPYTIRQCRDCDITKGSETLAFVPDNQLCAACKIVRTLSNIDIKSTRKQAKILQGTCLYHNSLNGRKILISRESIREWTNQPHKHFQAKNEMLLNIASVFRKARYMGTTDNHKGVPRVVRSHIFEIDLCGDTSLIIVREYEWGDLVLYSISDSKELYRHIKSR